MDVYIEAEEWPMIAGLIGLTQLLDDNEITIKSDGVILNTNSLDDLAQKYIYELIHRYNIADRDLNRLNWYISQMKKSPSKTKQYAIDIRKLMNDQLKKVKKYFSDLPETKKLTEVIEQMKTIKKEEDIAKVEELVDTYYEYASNKLINEKLTLNYVRTFILTPFFGQTSILQKTFSSKNTEEHIERIEKDFVEPAILELQFSECLAMPENIDEIVKFLHDNREYIPFKQWLNKIKKFKTIEEVKQYFQEDVLSCSFIEELPATQSYEEKIFTPLAFSKEKASNFYWEFDKKQPIPMSALARLIIFLSPIGMAFYSRKIGNEHSSKFLSFASIILSQESFSTIKNRNVHYRNLRAKGTSFGEAIVDVIQEQTDKAKRIKNSYLFIEIHSDYDSKKALLDYYHMPAYLVNYLEKYGKALTLMHHYDLRDLFLRYVMQGIDPIQVIFRYLREAISTSHHGEGAYHAVRERKRILNAKEGMKEMRNQDKVIRFIYYRGVELREQLIQSREEISDDAGTYRASGRKKLEGIAYRLINATKAGNKQAFMDTIFRLYLGTPLTVPSIFVDAFKDDGLDFETIASSFIAGMLSQESSKNQEGVQNNG